MDVRDFGPSFAKTLQDSLVVDCEDNISVPDVVHETHNKCDNGNAFKWDNLCNARGKQRISQCQGRSRVQITTNVVLW